MKKNILFAALLCLPLILMAHKDDKNPKYLLGAVPEVDGVVTFQKNFSVTDKNEQQIYDVMLAYIKTRLSATPSSSLNPSTHASLPRKRRTAPSWLVLTST